MAPIPIVRPGPPSPTLIDFSAPRRAPTLLDDDVDIDALVAAARAQAVHAYAHARARPPPPAQTFSGGGGLLVSLESPGIDDGATRRQRVSGGTWNKARASDSNSNSSAAACISRPLPRPPPPHPQAAPSKSDDELERLLDVTPYRPSRARASQHAHLVARQQAALAQRKVERESEDPEWAQLAADLGSVDSAQAPGLEQLDVGAGVGGAKPKPTGKAQIPCTAGAGGVPLGTKANATPLALVRSRPLPLPHVRPPVRAPGPAPPLPNPFRPKATPGLDPSLPPFEPTEHILWRNAPPWNTVSPSGRVYREVPVRNPVVVKAPPADSSRAKAQNTDEQQQKAKAVDVHASLPQFDQLGANPSARQRQLDPKQKAKSVQITLKDGSTLELTPPTAPAAPAPSKALASQPLPPASARTTDYDELLAALRKLALEPPIGPASDEPDPPKLSKKQRKRQREAALAQAQATADAQKGIEHIASGVNYSLNPLAPYFAPAYPSPTPLSLDPLSTFTPLVPQARKRYDLSTPPDLESPPDRLPSDGSLSFDEDEFDLRPAEELPECSLVAQPDTGNYADDKAIILSSDAEVERLFKVDIVALPFPKLPDSFFNPATINPKPANQPKALSVIPSSLVAAADANKQVETADIETRLEQILRELNQRDLAVGHDDAEAKLLQVLDKYTRGTEIESSARPQIVAPQPIRPAAQSSLVPAAPVLNPHASVYQAPSYPRYDPILDQTFTDEFLPLSTQPDLTRERSRDWESEYLYTPETGPLDFYDGADESEDATWLVCDRMDGQGPDEPIDNALRFDLTPQDSWRPGPGRGSSSRENARARWQNPLEHLAQPLPNTLEADTEQDKQAMETFRRDLQQRASSEPVEVIAPYERLLSLESPRLRVPSQYRFPARPDTLQSSLISSLMAAEPTEHRKLAIAQLTQRLTMLINRQFGPGTYDIGDRFIVDVFGSVSWGGETGRGGDLDLVIRDKDWPQGFHPSLWTESANPLASARSTRAVVKPPKEVSPVYDLRAVVPLLRRAAFADVQGIFHATTPIVKFRDQRAGLDCDINVNDLGGWYNSKLILAYCEISPYVLRPLIHVLKSWAKANSVNDPSGSKGPASMSSYCLTLMAIGYLQFRGVLPNLQADVDVPIPERPKDVHPNVIWAGWGRGHGTKIHVAFSPHPPIGWEPSTTLTAADAVRGFFEYFAIYDGKPRGAASFDYATQVVSVANGGVIQRAKEMGAEQKEVQARQRAGLPPLSKDEVVEYESRMGKGAGGIQPRNWADRRLIVQDPFIWQKNCTQSMAKAGLDRWLAAVKLAHITLLTYRENCNFNHLLSAVLPPVVGAGRGRTPSPMRGGMPSRAGAGVRPPSVGRGLWQG